MTQHPEPWVVDFEDPRAPPQEVWDRMTEQQQKAVLDSLPSEFPVSEANPPEGDFHTEEVYGARTALAEGWLAEALAEIERLKR